MPVEGMGLVVGVGVGAVFGAGVTWWLAKSRELESNKPVVSTGRVALSEQDLARLRSEPLFVDLLLMGRMVNALRFAHTAPLEVYDEGTPRAGRQLNNAFFVQVAFAVEALDALKKLNRSMNRRASWQASIVPLFRDPAIQRLDSETVRDLRRRVVFHFDREAIERGLTQTRERATTFLAMHGTRRMDVYFPFSDEVAVSLLVPTKNLSDEEYRARVLPWLRDATQLSLTIATAIERVMVDVGKELGLRGQWE